jgi:adenylate kinase
MLHLIIFGPPGSGKGTQSCRIVSKYKLIHISTGDLFRKEMARGTDLGREIAMFIDKGMLVPDDIVIKELQQAVDEYCCDSGFIFDGFPRTLAQAQMLDNMLEGMEKPVDLVLSVEVSEEELTKRLMGRSEDSGRSDDNADIIKKRIEVYKAQSMPLISFYSRQGKLVKVNGMDPVDDVFEKISLAVDTYIEKKEIRSVVN